MITFLNDHNANLSPNDPRRPPAGRKAGGGPPLSGSNDNYSDCKTFTIVGMKILFLNYHNDNSPPNDPRRPPAGCKAGGGPPLNGSNDNNSDNQNSYNCWNDNN